MTTYTFVAKAPGQDVNWSSKTIWSGGVVPNGPTADVVIPAVTNASLGVSSSTAYYVSDIIVSSAYTLDSLAIAENTLTLAGGGLTIAGVFNVAAAGEIDLGPTGTQGARLSFGSSENAGTIAGVGVISGQMTNDGTIIAGGSTALSSQTLDLTGSVTGSGVLEVAPAVATPGSDNQPWTLELGAGSTMNVDFKGPQGVLRLDSPTTYTGTITPMGGHDQVELAGVPLSAVTGYSYTGNPWGGTLVIDRNGGSPLALNFAGDFDTNSFSLSSGPGSSLLITNNGPATPLPDQLRDHFAGESASDMLIANASGAVVVGHFSSGQESYSMVGALGKQWTFHGTGDLLGDGKSGFLIENLSGGLYVGEVSGGATAYTQIAGLNSSWRVAGVGDYLGPDLGGGIGIQSPDVGGPVQDQVLVEEPNGQLLLVAAAGGHAVEAAVGALGSQWTIVGTGAFLGNGKAQFLAESASGAVAIGDFQSGAFHTTVIAGLGSDWKFVATGDFLGDNKEQFLIENAKGLLALGEIGADGQAHFTSIASLGPEWKFTGAGDYFGEGHDQFLIESTKGAVIIADYVGGQVAYNQIAALGPEWSFHG